MDSAYGNDYISIIDEDGNEFELEHLDSVEIDGELYMAFLPADMDEDDEDFGMIIFKVISENDEEVFASIDDEDELKELFDIFVDRLSEEEI